MKKGRFLILCTATTFLLAACDKKQPDTTAAADTQMTTAGMQDADQTAPVTSVAVSEPHFDFGDVKKGDVVSHTYDITNTGENPLIISMVKPGCGCTAPEYSREAIAPGETGKVTLQFDSSTFQDKVEKYAEVFANTEKTPIMLTFSANVKS
ncbi:MAG: DUF1573 domain-containing protein [Chryseobacterium sp.]|nr:MAG: DUF1573 domain-containing protein [Chryseobacterium sp.]